MENKNLLSLFKPFKQISIRMLNIKSRQLPKTLQQNRNLKK